MQPVYTRWCLALLFLALLAALTLSAGACCGGAQSEDYYDPHYDPLYTIDGPMGPGHDRSDPSFPYFPTRDPYYH